MADSPTISIKRRRRGLEFAENLARMAGDAPDDEARRDLYACVNRLRRRYGFSEAEKRQIVLHRVRVGAATIGDLVRETGFTQPDVSAIVRDLESGGLIRCEKISLSASGVGRPTVLIIPTEPN